MPSFQSPAFVSPQLLPSVSHTLSHLNRTVQSTSILIYRLPIRCTADLHWTSKESNVVAPDISLIKQKDKWDGMTLHFVTKHVSVDGRDSSQFRLHIEQLLAVDGDPVRWAIVDIDHDNGTCQVDAVVSRREGE